MARVVWTNEAVAAGERLKAEALVRELLVLSKEERVSPYLLAMAHVGVGDVDTAFAWLDRAIEERDSWVPFILVDPRWHSIRSDARFQNLARRIGLAAFRR